MSEKRYSDQEIEDAIENLESTDTYSSVINNAHRAGAAHIIRQLQADLKEAKENAQWASRVLRINILRQTINPKPPVVEEFEKRFGKL